MAWKIENWSREEGTGTVRSPHFDSVPFGPSANVDAVCDFELDEPVVIELDNNREPLRIRSIRPIRQRQPPHTRWQPFDRVNYQFGDALIEEQGRDSVQFWLGDCCEYCSPDAVRLRFEGVSTVRGLHDDCDFDAPLFRLASSDEIEEFRLEVPAECRAFCVVTSHGNGSDGPRAFIVAQRAEIVPARRIATET